MKSKLLLLLVFIVAGALHAQSTWTGATSTDWNTAGNWNPAGVPAATTDVIIPNTTALPNQPTIGLGSLCRDVTIEAGGVLNGGSGSLNIDRNWTNNGTFNTGTALIGFVGDSASNIGGTTPTTFFAVYIQKLTRQTEVFVQTDVTMTATGTAAGSAPLDIRQGTMRNNGNGITALAGRVTGTSPAAGELHVSGGAVNFDTVYMFSALKQVTITGGTFNTRKIDIVNSGHRVDISGGTLNVTDTVATTATSAGLRLGTNNPGWGLFGTGGVVQVHGSVNASIGCYMDLSGTCEMHFVGAGNGIVNLRNSTSTGSNNHWLFNHVVIDKSGAGTNVDFMTSGSISTNVAAYPTSPEAQSITINPGNTAKIGGVFQNSLNPWNIGDIINDGTVELIAPIIRLSGSIVSSTGATVTSTAGNDLQIVGTGTSVLTGDMGLQSLTCTAAGKTIVFGAGDTFQVPGVLTLTGASGNPVFLRSTNVTTPWGLANSGTVSLSYVDVQDSTASIQMPAFTGGIDSGNNTNWFASQNSLIGVNAVPAASQLVFANSTGPGGLGLQAASFTIAAGATGGGTLLDFEISASGTGNDAAAFSEVAVYQDGAAGAVGSYDNANDILIGTFASFPSNDGSLTFNVPGSEGTFAASQERLYFIVVKLSGTAVTAETFQFTVSDISTLGAIGGGAPTAVMDGIEIAPPGFEFDDNSGTVQGTAYAGQGGFVLQQFTISYPSGPPNTLTSLTFTGLTTGGNLGSDVTKLDIYRDANLSGDFDAADVLVSTLPGFDASNQAEFLISGPESSFTASTTPIQYFLVVEFSGSTPDGSTFQTQFQAADGASAGTLLLGLPAPAAGPAPGLEVLANNMFVSLIGPTGAVSVDSNSQGPNDDGHVVWSGTISVLNQPWSATELVFTASGSANHATAYNYVALFEDTNANGSFDGVSGGDALAVAAAEVSYGTGNVYTATLVNDAFPSFASRHFFLVVKLDGTAITGETLGAELTSITATPPAGGQISGDLGVPAIGLIIDSPSLTVANAETQPASITLNTGVDQGATIGKFRLTATNFGIDVQSISFMALGTGNPTLDLSATNGIEVYLDDGDGVFDNATDALLFAGPGGSPLITSFATPLSIAANSSEVIWVRLNVPAATGAGNTEARTYGVAIANAADVSTAGGVAVIIGSPLPESAILGVTDFFVTSFSPTSDLPAGGKPITIQGSGFEAPFVVRINGIVCPGVAVITPTEVTGLLVPNGGGKNLEIQIDSGLLATQILSQKFNYSTVGTAGSGGDGGGCTAGSQPFGLLAIPALALLAIVARRRRQTA